MLYISYLVVTLIVLSSVFHVGRTLYTVVLSIEYLITDRSHVGMSCLIQLSHRRVELRNIECNGNNEKLCPSITRHVKEQFSCYVKTLTKG